MKLKTILALFVAATIATAQPVHAETLPESIKLISQSDEDLILRVAMGEAGNQGIDGMRYVISTVLNRVDDPRFPGTIEEVITQPYQYYEGYSGAISEDCRKALDAELQEQIDTDVLWFCSTGWPQYGTHAVHYKDHYFNK